MSITLHSQPTGPLIVSQGLCYDISTDAPPTGTSRTLRWKLQREGDVDVTSWASCPSTDGSIININAMKDAKTVLSTNLPSTWATGSGVFLDSGASDKFRLSIAQVDVDTSADPCTPVVNDSANSNYVDVVNSFFFIDQEFNLSKPTWLSARPDRYRSCHGIIHVIGIWLPAGDWQIDLWANVKTVPLNFTYSVTSTGGVYHVVAHPDTWTNFEDADTLEITVLTGGGTPYSGISQKVVSMKDCCFEDEMLAIMFLEPQGGFASMVFNERMSKTYTRNKLLTCLPQACGASFYEYAESASFSQAPSGEKAGEVWRRIVHGKDDELWMRALLASNKHWILKQDSSGAYYLTSIYIQNGEFKYAKKDELTKLEVLFTYSKEFASV